MTKPEHKNATSAKQRDLQDRSPARSENRSEDAKDKDNDIPGADGPLSAGANEDTYD